MQTKLLLFLQLQSWCLPAYEVVHDVRVELAVDLALRCVALMRSLLYWCMIRLIVKNTH